MDARAREIISLGNRLFSDKAQVDSLWQEIALNFYPERADFTSKRNQGEEFADHLFSSYPVLAIREFGNILSEFVRPDRWVSVHVDDEDLDEGDEERAWLERLTDRFWRIINDPLANFVRASHETDRDFAAFGNGVLQYWIEHPEDDFPHFGFANHHLRDCAWVENRLGRVDGIWRNWNPTAEQILKQFPQTASERVRKECSGGAGFNPYRIMPCRHIVLPSRIWPYKSKVFQKKYPFCSLYVEMESETVLEEVGLKHFPYVVPRWETVSGSVYGSSLATAVILPDGRTLQVMMRTLREAGESYVNPPMIAFTDAIRGDYALYPGGVTTSDIEYDGKLADVLRPITKDRGGFPIGVELAAALKEDIRAGALLDKIQLPETDKAMTATEIRRRIQEHIRAAAPITKPIQATYNHPLCEGVYNLALAQGGFDDLRREMPESLSERNLKFKFRSPLDELAEQNEADMYIDARDTVLLPAIQVDPSLAEIVDMHEATRDALRAKGWKAKWFKRREAVDQRRAELEDEAQAQETVGDMAAAGAVAEQGGRGLSELLGAAQMAGMQPGGGPAAPGLVPAPNPAGGGMAAPDMGMPPGMPPGMGGMDDGYAADLAEMLGGGAGGPMPPGIPPGMPTGPPPRGPVRVAPRR